jgi:hypothetical protein
LAAGCCAVAVREIARKREEKLITWRTLGISFRPTKGSCYVNRLLKIERQTVRNLQENLTEVSDCNDRPLLLGIRFGKKRLSG